jgi:predicted metalloprotease with PDZ domain
VIAGLTLALAASLQQAPRDTLTYSVALVPQGPHLSVEARLTNLRGGPIVLMAPPAANRARTTVAGIAVTDDRNAGLPVRGDGRSWTVDAGPARVIRFRYRLEFRDAVADGSTGAAFNPGHMYAVTASLFVAPDPTALRKSDAAYPFIRLGVVAPAGWRVVTGFARAGAAGHAFLPRDGDELLGATLAAAPDFRVYDDSAAGTPFTVAVRGRRYFSDSLLGAVVRASLHKGAEALGPPPVPRVMYTSELGRKGRTSGSLHGGASIGLVWEPGELLERARAHDTFHETIHLWFGGAMETERWWTEGVTDYFAARLYASWTGNPEDLAALVYQSWFNYLNIGHNARVTMAQEARRGFVGDNTELLAYRKGMLAGLLLDAAVRRGSRGRMSLDHVARRLLELAATRRSRVVREAEIRDVVRAMGGGDAGATWDRVVAGTELLQLDDITRALREVTGRTFAAPDRPKRRKTLDAAVGA